MSRTSSESNGPKPRDLAAQIDAICDRFEAAWIAGERPQIEDYMSGVSEPGLAGLLDELIILDVTYRRRSGETPTRRDYLARFPGQGRGWDSVFAEAAPGAGRSLGPYRIEERLGAGSMGEVYRAHDSALGRDVALKVLPPGFSPSTRARLLREAWAGARVQHPGIATFYDAGEAGGIDYIAMEYVRGQTLRQVLRDGRLPPGRALAIASGLLEALAHAHAAGILHRDIKPENIMITGERSAKLLDLGLAKGSFDEEPARPGRDRRSSASSLQAGPVSDQDITGPDSETIAAPTRTWTDGLTGSGVVLGTPGYMAPEQIRGDAVDARADLFALGVVLHEMITGRRLFDGSSIPERLDATLSGEVPPLSGPGLPTGLDAVVARATARDPASRWSSAVAFLAELKRFGPTENGPDRAEALAVLDFRADPGDPPDDRLGGELADELAEALRRVEGLRVIPRAEVLAARAALGAPGGVVSLADLGVRLGADSILTGNLRGRGSGLRVRARLLDLPALGTSWEGQHAGAPDRIDEVCDRIAESVTSALGLTLPRPGRRPAVQPSSEAYRCLVLGRRLWWQVFARGRIDEACALLERAVALEPGYALALAVLAEVQAFRANISNDPRGFEMAIATAGRAIAVDPDLADAHLWLGYSLLHLRRPLEASRALRRARELDPENPQAHYFAGVTLRGSFRRHEARQLHEQLTGRPCGLDPHRWRRLEALGCLRRALELAPGHAFAWMFAGLQHLELGDTTEARRCFGESVRLEPISVPPLSGTAVFLGECSRRAGELDRARSYCLAGLEAMEKTDHLYRDTIRGIGLCILGRTTLQQGDRESARSAFRQAALLMRGRPRTRGGGTILVQALAGSARAGGGSVSFEEALDLFEHRAGWDFQGVLYTSDDITLLELGLAALELGKADQAHDLLARAMDCGSSEVAE